MLDLRVCPACARLTAEPVLENDYLTCTYCGHRWAFSRLPLFALTGPSGAGKSTVAAVLAGRLANHVVTQEQDVLWNAQLDADPDGVTWFRRTWLRLAAMTHQSGRSVLLCGTVVPPEFEPLSERAFVSDIHYLALISDSDVLARRLRARPAWRGWSEARIAEMLEFNDWLRASAATLDPPVELFDTTNVSIEDTVTRVSTWVLDRLT